MARFTFVDRWAIRAPLDAVFRCVADPLRYPVWWPIYRQARCTDLPGTPGPQLYLLTRSLPLRGQVQEQVLVLKLRAPRACRTGGEGPWSHESEWQLLPAGSGTLILWTWVCLPPAPMLLRPGSLAHWYYARVFRQASALGHQGLKRYLEQGLERPVKEIMLRGLV